MSPKGPLASSASSFRDTTPPPSAIPSAALQDTPISKRASRTDPYTSLHHERDFRMRRLGAEMEGKFVGPMPVAKFLNKFLPSGNFPTMPWKKKHQAAFKRVAKQGSEKAMYKPLIKALEAFCPNLELVDTHNHVGESSILNQSLLKPDITAYITKSGRDQVTDFSLMEIHTEVKFDERDDPFCDDSPESIEHDTEASKDTQGQITSYAVAQLATQFRSHIFSVLICGKYARLLRWDRSGAVVSKAFDYTGRHLAQFYWRYNHSDPSVRGVDCSVSKPSEKEAILARKLLKLEECARLVKFEVYDEIDDTVSYYIGSKPTFNSNASPTGRATRTFVVVDPDTERVVFLKDTWRIDLPHMMKEGTIYRALHKANVSNIPTFVRGDDVPRQRTRSQDFVSASWARPLAKPLRPHQHYRMVLGEVGRDLTSFDSTWELVNAMKDAMQAHKEAFEKAKILHRDISVGNILITNDGHGMLIDWDLSKHTEDLAKGARQGERSGTWQFMAARLLSSLTPIVHTLADDLESFLHVLSWVALRFTPHDLSPKALTSLLGDMFDNSYEEDDGYARGGLSKQNYLLGGQVPKIGFRQQILRNLLKDLTETCAVRYEERPSDGGLAASRKMQPKRDDELAMLHSLLAAQYERKLAALESSDWMLETFAEALANREAWPQDDKSIPNPLAHKTRSGRKRKSENNDDYLPKQRQRFMPSISEHLGERGSREGTSREGTSYEETSREETSGEGTSYEETSGEETSGEETSGEERTVD